MLEKAIDQIKSKGYVRLQNQISISEAAKLCDLLDLHWKNSEVESGSREPFLNRGHKNVYNVQNKSFSFLRVLFGNKLIEDILKVFLNDEWYRQIPPSEPNYILRSFGARSSGPEDMPLHIDSFIPSTGEYVWGMQVAFILQPQTRETGCTVVVPGTHLSGEYAKNSQELGEIEYIESQAGDIVIWDSRIWHGALANKSPSNRWSLIATFCRWWIKQNYKITETLDREFYEKLTDSQKAIMGFCSEPPIDEWERKDMKSGYEIFQEK